MGHTMNPVMNEDMFVDCFGSAATRLSSLPHCVSRCEWEVGKSFLRSILDVTNAVGARWGSQRGNLVDTDGSFLLRDFHDDPSLFHSLWMLPHNQQELACEGALPVQEFSMVINVDTPPSVLAKLAQGCRKGKQLSFWHDDCLNLVVDLIDELRWAYIPLSDEIYFGMFVTRKSDSAWITNVAKRLSVSGEEVYAIRSRDGRCELLPFQQ